MNQDQPLTVSVGIIAYNEQQNIANLLESVLRQKETCYSITEIIIISDGSTDQTNHIINGFKDPRIKSFFFNERIGKSQHLNTIFQKAQGSIIALFDADVILANRHVIDHLVMPFIKVPHLGLVGGNPQPRKGKTFIENAVNSTFEVYDQLRLKIKGGNNAFGCDGRILALSQNFAKTVTVPSDMIANDAFMYFSCITKGFNFRHARKAIVWFRSPITLRDHLRQNKRFIAAHYRLERIFGPVVKEEYKVPPEIVRPLLRKQCFKKPFHSVFIFFINRYCALRARWEERKMNARWAIAVTTKGGIS